MEISIKKIATLAKLSLSPAEEGQYSQELKQILGHIEMMGEVDTSHVLPTSQSTGLLGKEREDKPENTPLQQQQDALLACSTYRENQFIKVPPVL